MAFTTRDIVKKHILDHHLGATNIENEIAVLTGKDWSQLERRMILKDSEKVKGKEQLEPASETVSFGSGDTYSLSQSELIHDTVVAASDSSLGKLYVENVDFHVDYDKGEISRLNSGSIPAGAKLTVWYLYYRVYERGVDYDIDFQQGRIRRISSGDVESGQRVEVDYTTEQGSLDDEAIENAISEANNQVLKFIDESYHNSTDKSLIGAETYLAVSIICRVRAMESISPSRGKPAGVDAMSWTSIAEMYKKEAFNLLSGFAGAMGAFNPPSKA